MAKNSQYKVAILAHPQVSLFELGCAVELFALPRPELDHWYQAQVICFADDGESSVKKTPGQTYGGLGLEIKTISSLAGFTHLVIPYWPVMQTDIGEKMARQIRAFAKAGKTILSFCSGAFLLAELGLLDNQPATTHWRYAEIFKDRFPQVNYRDNVLYLFDGQLGCSAGSAAALDLGIALIRHDFGYAIANQVARRLVMPAHRSGGQAQFVETPLLEVPNQFAAALDWAIENIEKPMDIDQLAKKSHMSRRTFDRKFRSSLQQSPQQWLVHQRLERAKGLLEQQSLPMDQLAQACGFDNAMTLRHHFRKLLGISPMAYRKQFQSS